MYVRRAPQIETRNVTLSFEQFPNPKHIPLSPDIEGLFWAFTAVLPKRCFTVANRGTKWYTLSRACFGESKTRNNASYIRRAHVPFTRRPFVRACDSSTTRFPRYSGGKLTPAARANRSSRPRFWTRALPLPHKATAVSPSSLKTTGVLPRAPQRATKTVPSWSQSGRRRRRVGSL